MVRSACSRYLQRLEARLEEIDAKQLQLEAARSKLVAERDLLVAERDLQLLLAARENRGEAAVEV